MSLNPKRLVQLSKNYFWHLPKSILFNMLYGFPSKKLILIGVTGTDGKTTTCTLIHQLLVNAGLKAEVISTINSPGLHTTSPDPSIIQKLFSQMVKNETTHVVVEVTSHSLDQFRFWGCFFEYSVLTNISHEHLDYHCTISNYISAKTKLFHLSHHAILNNDDSCIGIFKKLINIPFCSYSIINKSDYQATKISVTEDEIKFNVDNQTLITDSPFYYQIYNILATYILSKKLNIDNNIFKATIATFPITKGRRELVDNEYKIKAYVDFAHTPAALEATLSSLKKITKNNLIVIFGATGGRDQSKRPLMGDVVSKNSHIAIITADDTRGESVENINSQIISGITSNNSIHLKPEDVSNHQKIKTVLTKYKNNFIYLNIPHRQDAFNLAVKMANSGDIIVACGKGHETTILHGKTEYPWSETEAFKTAFKIRH
jgi:UDP-N-acetylmuramoyl-L-alanyl-D-glutamate--2,6-diaminopimelate ligase